MIRGETRLIKYSIIFGIPMGMATLTTKSLSYLSHAWFLPPTPTVHVVRLKYFAKNQYACRSRNDGVGMTSCRPVTRPHMFCRSWDSWTLKEAGEMLVPDVSRVFRLPYQSASDADSYLENLFYQPRLTIS